MQYYGHAMMIRIKVMKLILMIRIIKMNCELACSYIRKTWNFNRFKNKYFPQLMLNQV